MSLLKGAEGLGQHEAGGFVPLLCGGFAVRSQGFPRLKLVAGARSSPAAWSMSCGSPVNTHGQGFVLLCTLQPQNSLTCGFALLQPDLVKAFLISLEQGAALGHGAMIKINQAVRQRLGVLGETSLLIYVLTSDSLGVMRLPCTLVLYLWWVNCSALHPEGFWEKNGLGGEQVFVQESGELGSSCMR